MTATIQITEETKKMIKSFGTKEDTYEDIIKRLYTLAVKWQLREFSKPSKNTISIEEAKRRINDKYS